MTQTTHTLASLAAMDAVEREALVAEKVMEWKPLRTTNEGKFHWFTDGTVEVRVGRCPILGPGWSPSYNLHHDYMVLHHVRETWGKRQLWFSQMMYWIQSKRGGYQSLAYRPGDYALAALAVVMGVEE